MNGEQLFINGFLYGLALGGVLGGLLFLIGYADAKPSRRRKWWIC